MPVNRSMGLIEWSLLALLSVLWGGAFFFVAVAIETLPPLTIVTLRIGIAAVVLNLIMRITGIEMPAERRLWIAFAGMGLLNNVVPFCLIAWGQIYIASGLASILNATTPFCTVIVAHFLTRDEKLTAARLSGIAIAFAGVVAIVGPETLEGVDADTLAQLAVLGAAVSFAFAAVFGRRFRDMGAGPLVTATGQLDRLDCDACSSVSRSGSAVVAAGSGLGIGGRRCGPCPALDCAGLHPLFSHPGHGRRDEPASGDPPDPGYCRSSGSRRPSTKGWTSSTLLAWRCWPAAWP